MDTPPLHELEEQFYKLYDLNEYTFSAILGEAIVLWHFAYRLNL